MIAAMMASASSPKYLRPQKAAAEEILQAAAGTKRPEFWLHYGYKNTSPKSRSPTRNQGNQRAPDNNGLKGRLVELIWIEPTAHRASSSGRRLT
jgi:hypothetical protein